MTEEKSPFNPFAHILRETETLIWTAHQEVGLFQTLVPIKPLYLQIGAAILVGLLGISYLLGYGEDVLKFLVGLVVIIFIMMIRHAFSALGDGFSLSTPDLPTLYAVTSERLLSLEDGLIHALPLEKLSLIQGSRKYHTLNFGIGFPAWSGLKDGEQVKTIIEQAKKDRLKELNT